MTDTQTVTNGAATPAAPATEAKKFDLQSVERMFLNSETEMGANADTLNKIVDLGASVISNIDLANEPLPDGFGILVLPISERSKSGEGNITKQVVISAVPSLDLLLTSDKGRAFLADAVATSFGIKIKSALRVEDGPVSLPKTFEDFVEGRTRGGAGDLKTFSELAPTFVDALRQKGLKVLTKQILRAVLSSKAAALDFFPKAEEGGAWVNVLNAMILKAKEKNLDPAILNHWVATRDQATATQEDEESVDFADISALVANVEKKEADAAAKTAPAAPVAPAPVVEPAPAPAPTA